MMKPKSAAIESLAEYGAIGESSLVDAPHVDAPLEVVLEALDDSSKPRALTYAFGATIIAMLAFYLKWEVDETAVWVAMLGAGVPFGALVVATARTWPKRSR